MTDPSGRPQELPSSVVVDLDGCESYWQPVPARGFVAIAMSPDTTSHEHFTAGLQVLPAGCSVRAHGHRRNHELVFVQSGTGECVIDGVRHALRPSCAVLFGRHAVHQIVNTGSDDLRLFWVFMPPGLEDWFRAIGRRRVPGDPMPEPFDRPADVAEAQARQRFVLPGAPKS